jgi:hypothetical protein
MGLGCAAATNAVGVLVADANQMQCQLLVSALRRRQEFQVSFCGVDMDAIFRSVASMAYRLQSLMLIIPRMAGRT